MQSRYTYLWNNSSSKYSNEHSPLSITKFLVNPIETITDVLLLEYKISEWKKHANFSFETF